LKLKVKNVAIRAEGKSGMPKNCAPVLRQPSRAQTHRDITCTERQIWVYTSRICSPTSRGRNAPTGARHRATLQSGLGHWHIFGRAPSVSIKNLPRLRFSMNRVISVVWDGGESDINIAGSDVPQGYQALQFAGVGKTTKSFKTSSRGTRPTVNPNRSQ
jgi:hypothetical protein